MQEANLGSMARKEEGRLASAAVLEHPLDDHSMEHVSRVGGLSKPIRHRHAASRIPRWRRDGADSGGRRGGGGSRGRGAREGAAASGGGGR